jgi:hypothetical protein
MTTSAYFNRSRLQVIGLITAATIAVGALGGIAGIVFDADPVRSDPVPAVSGGATGSGGGQARLFIAQPAAAPDGKFVKLRNGVRIFVPKGWTVYSKDAANINFTDDNGSYAYAYSGGGFDPSSSAAEVVFDNLDGILPPDSYTDRTVSEFMPWGEPFGTVLSVGWLEYHATWVDSQGSQPIIGQIYAGVRQDGTVLIHLLEHLPPEGFNAAFENVPIVWPTFERFGAAG